ncbi:protein phosphatase 1 regulatory subunit 14A-like [Corythoichthys intestinalis]|uniref:protein phosphatase 1 regulatory subunit 14A-like n=1 Tax=Corythoichthys intestinalis TaxID=161448 RepID=UPI0025A5CB07|nr:protein phosphatase 1 regulatory subunit 14A-like [Corythoichthys intestinalis]XP_061800939.1 protein phosphatase 1 regulatory subunit 14A-like [Nerophis lumbriciformis]
MAADRTGMSLGESEDVVLSDETAFEEHGGHAPKRHARVTVKYNRKELQRRLDVEKWIDERLDELYAGQEEDMPEEVNIDELIDLPDDVERVKKLQELFQTCNNTTETFIRELVEKLQGVHKEEELQSEGIEHPVIGHSHHRHEPYHFNNPHHVHHTRSQNQTL